MLSSADLRTVPRTSNEVAARNSFSHNERVLSGTKRAIRDHALSIICTREALVLSIEVEEALPRSLDALEEEEEEEEDDDDDDDEEEEEEGCCISENK
jgi:hypothetical protein